jgi:hypothetical protein
MLPPDAGKRLVLSKTTLDRYEAMGAGVGMPSPRMTSDEIETLRGIAILVPAVTDLVSHLTERWISYATNNGLTLN